MVSQYSSEFLHLSIIHADNRLEKEPKLMGDFSRVDPECRGENPREFVKGEPSFPLKPKKGSGVIWTQIYQDQKIGELKDQDTG